MSTNWRDCILCTSLRGIGGKLEASEKSRPVMGAREGEVVAGSTDGAVVGTKVRDVDGGSRAAEGSRPLAAERVGADNEGAEDRSGTKPI